MLKRIAWFGFGALAAVIAVTLAGKWWWDAQYFTGYNAAAPLDASVRTDTGDGPYRRIEVVYNGRPGDRVPAILALPPGLSEPAPCIIFLHGIGQDKSFLDDIAERFTDAGFAIASFDQLMRGERKSPDHEGLAGLFALRERAAANVVDTRRFIDYLETRDDINTERVYLLGASFGAITGANAAAFDPRIRAVVLTYGGGDLGKLLRSDVAYAEVGALTDPLASFAAFFFAPADPIQYVAQISPRPLLIQNGRQDTVVPFESGKALFDAAAEPKEFVAYDSDHIGLDEAHVIRVLDDTIDWLKEQDALITGQGRTAAAAFATTY